MTARRRKLLLPINYKFILKQHLWYFNKINKIFRFSDDYDDDDDYHYYYKYMYWVNWGVIFLTVHYRKKYIGSLMYPGTEVNNLINRITWFHPTKDYLIIFPVQKNWLVSFVVPQSLLNRTVSSCHLTVIIIKTSHVGELGDVANGRIFLSTWIWRNEI